MRTILHILLLVLLSTCSLSMMAQRRTFVRAGLNFPISSTKDGNGDNSLGLSLALEHRFKTPLEVGFQVSTERYVKYFTTTIPFGNGQVPVLAPVQLTSIGFLPYANYHLYETRNVSTYIGAGAGVSLDNNEEDTHAVLVPRCGVRVFQRFDLNFQYYISAGVNSRAVLTLSYRI